MDVGDKINNPFGGTAVDGNDVVFLDALVALLADDEPVAATNTDATSELLSAPRPMRMMWNWRQTHLASRQTVPAPPWTLTLPSASRPTGATFRGTTSSQGWVLTTSTAPSRILLATAFWAIAPPAFPPGGTLVHRHPAVDRSVQLTGMPPRRRMLLLASRPEGAPRRGTATSRGRAPTTSTATSRILTTAHWAITPSAFRPGGTSAQWHPPTERTIRPTGMMPLLQSR